MTERARARPRAGPGPPSAGVGRAFARPRLKRTAELLSSPDGDVYVLRPGAASDLVIERPDPTARRLLAALDGTHLGTELAAEFGASRVGEALDQLAAAELLEDALDDERVPHAERARYDRQLRYFSDISTVTRPSEHQARLRRSRIVMLGVGGLGSWASFALACCGIGELVLVDGDRVEQSNFNRQILYREEDVGRPKVDAARRSLAAFNSSCTLAARHELLDGPQAVRAAVRGADFVVNGADWPAHDIERWVNLVCFDEGIPFISMSHAPPVARVGPLYVPGQTGCFACQEAAYREIYPDYDHLVKQRRGRPSPAATLGPVCAFVGGQVALEALHHLSGLCRPATLGAGHIYDLRTMDVTREDVRRSPGCEVCGGA